MNITEIIKGKAYTDGADGVRRVLNIKRAHAGSKKPNSNDTVLYEMISGTPASFDDSVGLSAHGFIKFTMQLGDFAEWAQALVNVLLTDK
jgi:hypothetical protein